MNRSNLWLAAVLISVTVGSIVLGRYLHGPGAAERELSLTSPPFTPQAATAVPNASAAASDTASGSTSEKTAAAAKNKRELKLGLSINDPRAFRGYTLLASLSTPKTYLIDLEGRVVRDWEGTAPPALSGYLLPNGNLLRACSLEGKPHHLNGPGAGGRIQEFHWNGEIVWDLTFTSDSLLPHHDLVQLPNGNVLLIAWDRKSAEEAVAAGRREIPRDGHFLPDCLVEIKPTGKSTGEVVWEWHVWDHLIQDYDRSKAHYGDVAAHPELIDINFGESPIVSMLTQPDGVAKLRSIGYLGSKSATQPPRTSSDWTHANSVDYDSTRDLIMLSVHAFSEIWIIDHSTTAAEAAGHSGGRRGKGGDLVYRWGNPRTYRGGTAADQRLFFQHSAHWIPPGVPGAGHLLVFNNGSRRPKGPYSSVDEVALPESEPGNYVRDEDGRFGPREPLWSYSAANPIEFYSMLLSGAQRLPNGNTLICSGMSGTIFEVTPEKDIVWRYTCPVPADSAPGGPGTFGSMGPPGGSAVFRAYRYAPDYPGLADKKLQPRKTVEELHAKKPAR